MSPLRLSFWTCMVRTSAYKGGRSPCAALLDPPSNSINWLSQPNTTTVTVVVTLTELHYDEHHRRIFSLDSYLNEIHRLTHILQLETLKLTQVGGGVSRIHAGHLPSETTFPITLRCRGTASSIWCNSVGFLSPSIYPTNINCDTIVNNRTVIEYVIIFRMFSHQALFWTSQQVGRTNVSALFYGRIT